MIGRQHRFHGYNSVLPVYKGAQVARGEGCSLHYRLNQRRKDWRLAVVVSKKVSKSAVVRNRIRRRVYTIVQQSVQIDQPFDLLVTAYDEELATIQHEELKKRVTGLFRKAHIS